MKILLVDGAPRKNGFTREMVELFAQGATNAGGYVHQVRLSGLDVRPCLGCYGCWSSSTPGSCVQRDDMAALIERFYASDALVLATPVYYYSFSALLKAFIERLLPTTRPGVGRGRNTGICRNRMRRADRGPDRSVLIAVGAHRDLENMAGIEKCFELICEGTNTDPCGRLLRPESYLLDFTLGKPVTQRRVRAAFERAGRELVTRGCVAHQTEIDAASRLTSSEEMFGRHFDNYWRIASEIGAAGSDRARIRRVASEDPRILIPELAECYDAGAGDGLEAAIQLEIDSACWRLEIADGRCEACRGAHPNPELTLRTDAATFADLVLQRIDPRAALRDERVVADGSRSLLARFPRLFPPPSK
ncbi:MAG: NAD(P)H-dependent oxidoreductase [Polyangia bacterium]